MQATRVQVGEIVLQVQDNPRPSPSPCILFLHFSGANLMMWQPALPAFQDRYRLIRVDLRGHGRSDRPTTGYDMDTMARDVVGVLDALDVAQTHIVGSSLGAEVGLSLAANYPGRVISLVCDGALASEFGPYGTWEGTAAEFDAHVAAQLEKFGTAPDPVYPSVDALVAERRTLFEKYLGWNASVEAVERYGAVRLDDGRATRGMGQQAMADYLSNYFHARLEEYYRRVQCPLLMVAEEEAESERETAVMHALRDLAARAQIVHVAGWDHPYGWLLDPDNVCQTVRTFIDSTTR